MHTLTTAPPSSPQVRPVGELALEPKPCMHALTTAPPSSPQVRPVGELALEPKLLDKLHEKLAHEYNVRIFVEGYADGGPSDDKTVEETKDRNRQYLRRVFSTFDENNSGIITLLKVRARSDCMLIAC